MSYEEIKRQFSVARTLIANGDAIAADQVIKSMIGKGMCPADVGSYFTSAELRALRQASIGCVSVKLRR